MNMDNYYYLFFIMMIILFFQISRFYESNFGMYKRAHKRIKSRIS